MTFGNFPIPELERFPMERRNAIVESFNASPEAASYRKRFGKLPLIVGLILTFSVIFLMLSVFDIRGWPCILAGFASYIVGLVIGLMLQFAFLRRSISAYARKNFPE